MPEILTESFCERCGTRYTFESARPRARSLKPIKVLGRGLKNFVLSDDTSMGEAMAAARSEVDRDVTAQQLDAFHKTFNFCMSCRQYTCGTCWNEAEGRCLTCAPHLGHEIMPAPFPDLDPTVQPMGAAHESVANANGAAPATNGSEPHAGNEAAIAWPQLDLDGGRATGTADTAADESSRTLTSESADAPAADVDAEDVEPEATSADESSDEDRIDVRAAAAAARTSGLFARFRPGQSIDEVLDEYEREAGAAASLETPEPVAAADMVADVEAEPEPVAAADMVADVEAEPEPVAAADMVADVEAEPEPVAAADMVADVEAEPEPASADIVEQPVWRITAPDLPSTTPESPPEPRREPSWPSRPKWPASREAGSLPFLGRQAVPTGEIQSLWAESSRGITAGSPTDPSAAAEVGVRPCISCGLSLSATARFCRRCGTSQGA